MRPIDSIIIHCTATRPDWWANRSTAQKVAEIRRWHVQDRGWKDIGYHFLIDRNGKVMDGRPVEKVGAHVASHNEGTIGIALFGGHGAEATDKFLDHFTPEQDKALRNLLHGLFREFGTVSIHGHNEYAAKACPGFQVSDWLTRKADPQPPKPTGLAALLSIILSIFAKRA